MTEAGPKAYAGRNMIGQDHSHDYVHVHDAPNFYDGQNIIMEMASNCSQVANYTFGMGIDEPVRMPPGGSAYFQRKMCLAYHTNGSSVKVLIVWLENNSTKSI